MTGAGLAFLRELGAKARIVVPEPNTWKEVVDAVASLEQLGASVTAHHSDGFGGEEAGGFAQRPGIGGPHHEGRA